MSAEKTIARGASGGPDFRHVESWVFDLDHTLYRMGIGTMRATEERICGFVQRHLALPRDEAYAIQKKYLREYGITLAGMMKHHGVDPDAYHDAINDIEALALAPDETLRAALARLPGRRFVFTNNCGRFARAVLSRLAVEDLFEDVLDIRTLGYVPKPDRGAYRAILNRTESDAAHIALFDDRPCNLVPAHALGMTTVWFADGEASPEEQAAISYRTDNLPQFLNSVRTRPI
jgi:putative hydrolase of the HAD superfamily